MSTKTHMFLSFKSESVPGGIACDEGAVCITEDLWCDGNFDCHDGYDEISCATEDSEVKTLHNLSISGRYIYFIHVV